MTVTVVSSELGSENSPAETEEITEAEVAIAETQGETAVEIAKIEADRDVTLAVVQADAIMTVANEELETWRADANLRLSSLETGMQELREGMALLTGAIPAFAGTGSATNSEPSIPETSIPAETVEVETPIAAVTITEPELQENDDSIPSEAKKPRRKWT
jgi:hypothetical protein